MRREINAITATLLAIMMVLSLCGCGGTESGSSEENGSTGTPGQESSVTHDEEGTDMLLLEVNGQTLEVQLEDNEAARALKDLIGEAGLKLDLEEYGGFEKVGPLPESLPANDAQINTVPGDIVLYQGNQISLFYGENSWSYTKLGHVTDMDGAQLQEILGDGDVSVILRISE